MYEGDIPVVESEIIQVIQGKLDPKQSDKYQRFATILSWADSFRKLRVRANADVPDQAKIARGFGAEGSVSVAPNTCSLPKIVSPSCRR